MQQQFLGGRRVLLGAFLVMAASTVVTASCSDDAKTTATATDAGTAVDADTSADASEAGAAGTTTLGGACASNDECATGLECLRDNPKLDVWPARGLCTAKCDATDAMNPAGEKTCTAIAPGAHCVRLGSGQGYCVEGCSLGPSGGVSSLSIGPLPKKCHGRSELNCRVFLGGGYGCYPTCNSDAACGSGAHCDVFGFCTTDPVDGWDEIGKTAGTCKGHLATGGAASTCTAACTVGVTPSCGWAGPGTKAQAACLIWRPGGGRGDEGFCQRLCDCESDCAAPYKCAPLSAAFAAETGRAGVCSTTPSSNLTCGDAGADGG